MTYVPHRKGYGRPPDPETEGAGPARDEPGYHHPIEDARVENWRCISAGGWWCGEPMSHRWPGYDDGAPHPPKATP